MISISIPTTLRWATSGQWKNLTGAYSHVLNTKRNYNRSIQNLPRPTTLNIGLLRHGQCRLQNAANCFEEPNYFVVSRSFSTSSRDYNIEKKLGAYYLQRDIWRAKRKVFYQKFAAARFVNAVPASWQPYLQLTRVDKPTGTWLLYLPCAFSICLATPLGSLPNIYYLALFGMGAFLMRGAGCIINDLWDRDLDKHVERTKVRPLASGKLQPKHAITLLASQLSLSLGILLSLNTTCILIGVASMIPVILYPLAKRVTYFPQAVLGLTFNIGAIMGYAAVAGSINWGVVAPLYFGCFLWTMYYDTIYAVQDVVDDAAVGIKSTALLLLTSANREEFKKLPVGERLKEMQDSTHKLNVALMVCHAGTMTSWLLSFAIAGLAFPAYAVPLLNLLQCYPAGHSVTDPAECWDKFVESKNRGLQILILVIIGAYLARPNSAKTNEDFVARNNRIV